MKRIRHSPEQIIRKLREADAELAKGTAIPEVCKALGIAENTYYRWRNQFGGIKADEMRRLKELGKEDARLKALVAELALDKAILKEAARETPEPGPEAAGRHQGDDGLQDLRASGLPSIGRAPIEPAVLRNRTRTRRRVVVADEDLGPRKPPLWLPSDQGPARARRLVGQPQACPPALAS